MDYKVIIPDEFYSIIEFTQDGFLGIASVNTSLRNFEPKIVFSWHLSIMIQLEKVNNDHLPIKSEIELLDGFEDNLNERMKGDDLTKPNAVFLSRISWDNTVELIWRIHDPEMANNVIQQILIEKSYPRNFDYRIDNDPQWKLSAWHLSEHD